MNVVDAKNIEIIQACYKIDKQRTGKGQQSLTQTITKQRFIGQPCDSLYKGIGSKHSSNLAAAYKHQSQFTIKDQRGFFIETRFLFIWRFKEFSFSS